MGRICAVKGCSKSTVHLDKWREKTCKLHNMSFGRCYCKPPFALHPFPTQRRDPEARQVWIEAIDRKTPAGLVWQPPNFARVCSRHFKDGEPTDENPYPTKHLGHKNKTSSKHKTPKEPVCGRFAGDIPPGQEKTVDSDTPTMYSPRVDHNYQFRCDRSESCDCNCCVRKQKDILKLKDQVDELHGLLVQIKSYA